MSPRVLLVTIDTEVDKDTRWRVSDPVRFRSVTEGIPQVLSPLFDKYGVKPTYFLSPEVIEDPECVAILKMLGDRAELGTHLHSEFIGPQRRLFRSNMAGAQTDAIQSQFGRDVEEEKLANLTRLFHDVFGFAPTSFRAGRFGMSLETPELLAALGYRVDSSVTPGLRWDYREGVVDFRGWSPSPRWLETPAGPLLELPLSIRPGSPLARRLRDAPRLVRRAATGLLGSMATYQWLRPSWGSGADLVRYAKSTPERFLNLMFHSMEVIPGASPYARSEADVHRIVAAMDTLFDHCAGWGYQFSSVSEIVAHI